MCVSALMMLSELYLKEDGTPAEHLFAGSGTDAGDSDSDVSDSSTSPSEVNSVSGEENSTTTCGELDLSSLPLKLDGENGGDPPSFPSLTDDPDTLCLTALSHIAQVIIYPPSHQHLDSCSRALAALTMFIWASLNSI